MNAERLLAHYERVADAPDAVARLRRFILDLAVRGKLVPPDPNDEPASELICRVQAQRALLQKGGLVKPREQQKPITENELDYELPANWEPKRIGDLLTVIRGASPRPKGDPKYFSSERTPYHWIKISDIRKHSRKGVLYDTDEFLTRAGMEKSVLLPAGTLVVTNSATIGVPIFLGLEGGCIHDGYLAFPYFPAELSKDFFFVLFQTLQAYAAKKARGMAQLNLNTGLVREFPVGLPPLAEQRRIVAKVDELMALCDRLAATRKEREATRDRLTAVSLARLNAPDANPAVFVGQARFALDNVAALTERPNQIEQIRETILNLAMRGLLVPQLSSEENGSAQLTLSDGVRRRVAAEDRRADPESRTLLAAEEIWGVPVSWEWRALADLVLFIDYRGKTPKKTSHGTRLITAKNVRRGFINRVPEEFLSDQDYGTWMTRGLPAEGDVLFTTEAPLGNAAVVRIMEPFALAQRLICFRQYGALHPEFLVLQLLSKPFQLILNKTATGLTAKGIKAAKLKRLPFAVPPLAEQRRIVAKVDELMALCDRLEASLVSGEDHRSRLLNALLAEALAAAETVVA